MLLFLYVLLSTFMAIRTMVVGCGAECKCCRTDSRAAIKCCIAGYPWRGVLCVGAHTFAENTQGLFPLVIPAAPAAIDQ